MRRGSIAALKWSAAALGLMALSGASGAQTPPASPTTPAPAQSSGAPRGGYLAGHEPDTVGVLAQVPAPGSARDLADRQIFRDTRALEGTPRWTLAQTDAVLTLSSLLKDFSCAAGVTLTPKSAPALTRIIRRMAPDLASAYGQPKDLYKRPRPFLRDPGDICIPRSPDLVSSFDYPSGHSTFAWTFGLILAELEPDRAGPVLARARAFGESRAVCGVHSASAVTEARSAAAALFAALQSNPAFQTDLASARAELAAPRDRAPSAAPDAGQCQTEAALIARTPW